MTLFLWIWPVKLIIHKCFDEMKSMFKGSNVFQVMSHSVANPKKLSIWFSASVSQLNALNTVPLLVKIDIQGLTQNNFVFWMTKYQLKPITYNFCHQRLRWHSESSRPHQHVTWHLETALISGLSATGHYLYALFIVVFHTLITQEVVEHVGTV